MFLGLQAPSLSVFSNVILIPKQAFSKVTLQGNTIFDGVHLRNRELDDSEIFSITTQEVYGLNSVFLANYEGTLEAGNYTALSKPIVKWRVRRKLIGNFTPKFLGELNVNTVSFTDYLQANRTNYEYQVSPISDDGTEGAPITAFTQSDFFGWYLCSLDNKTVYKFDMNVESDSISLNMDIKLFEGFTQYPTTRQGKRRYHSGGLKTMPYNINGNEITINNELLHQVENFISNGEPKILKNTSGDLFKVATGEFSYQYMDAFNEQPFTINFKWMQVGEGE